MFFMVQELYTQPLDKQGNTKIKAEKIPIKPFKNQEQTKQNRQETRRNRLIDCARGSAYSPTPHSPS